MGKNMAKKVQKVENRFSSRPFFKGSRKLVPFFQIQASRNEIVHTILVTPL